MKPNGSFAAEKKGNEGLNYFFEIWALPKSQKNNSSPQKNLFRRRRQRIMREKLTNYC
jgi:hypothetical protein